MSFCGLHCETSFFPGFRRLTENLLHVVVPASERAALTAREDFYDYDSRVGKVTAVNDKDRSSGGFYCALCDVLSRDSLSFTNHLNGRKHLRKAGISEYTKRSTLDEVLAVLEFGRRKKYPERYVSQQISHSLESSKSASTMKSQSHEHHISVLEGETPAKRAKYEEDEKSAHQHASTPSSERIKPLNDITNEDDEEMQSMIGFSSFGAKGKTSKKRTS